MKRQAIVGIAGAMLVAGSALAGISPAGSADLPAKREAAEPVVAGAVTAVARGAQASARGTQGPVVDFLYARNPTVPPEGGGVVQPIRCPRSAGRPIGGGARTSQGIVVAYLSRVSPTGNRPKRTYFVGVEDVSAVNPAGSGALIEVQCAKNMVVRS
ncbi:MAG: hypothetical protein M3383_00870 [Actinomycetota bacterium]|nr:hypothetical protein [Actinomycetota bacterium]